MRTALRLFFALLYHQFAFTYDLVAAIVSAGKWQRWVLSILPSITGPNVLEIGHGPGHLQTALFRQGLAPVGLDASPQMGRIARRRLMAAGFSPHLLRGFSQALPFPPSSFNQVVATFPTEYIFDPRTLTEIYRVLQPGGELLFVPAAWITGRGLPNRLAALLFRLTRQAPTWNAAYEKPFRQANFTIQVEYLELPSSRVLLVHAKKR